MPAPAAALNPVHWIRRTERLRRRFSRLPTQTILDPKFQRAISPTLLPLGGMARAGSPVPPTAYEEALNCLSSLIIRRTRADGAKKGDNFDLMFDYLKILELDESITHLKVIHAAGTKGKGSTCAFTEFILRSCGFRTGLFTSTHLIDVQERFQLDG